MAGERNEELQDYYELLWHFGGSQTDMASLRAEDIDWTSQTLSYARMKTGSQAMIRFGDAVVKILQSRPSTGYLFPQIVRWKQSDRAKIFIRRCRLVNVSGVSLHSYRYAWAERASRLRVNLLTRQCLVSVVLEHWGIDVAKGLASQMHYHGRYEKRKRQNIVEKLFSLA